MSALNLAPRTGTPMEACTDAAKKSLQRSCCGAAKAPKASPLAREVRGVVLSNFLDHCPGIRTNSGKCIYIYICVERERDRYPF